MANDDPIVAKALIFEYAKKRGALAVGVADLEAIQRIAPAGHRPSDIMPRVRSVIALGVGGQTQGAWSVPAKAMAYFGSTETRAYSCAAMDTSWAHGSRHGTSGNTGRDPALVRRIRDASGPATGSRPRGRSGPGP